jgi:hypothetical protein
MMSSYQTMKVTKIGETVISDDPRVGIGLGTVPEPGGFNSDAVFDADDPQKQQHQHHHKKTVGLDVLIMMFWSVSFCISA